jgi:hypothetical protein
MYINNNNDVIKSAEQFNLILLVDISYRLK